jgi:D-beta-D-heptose 7-phosphate kinase/D-beta-D-heptose 1-phosphate adenosyltransferase
MEDLSDWRKSCRATGKKLVVTNGCFDLLHLGHVSYLETARNMGDALLVGVNSDASVRALKGPGRPLNSQEDRALVLAALEAVDAVCVFEDSSATRFLSLAQPDLWIKGGDYTLESLNQEERRAVEGSNGQIKIIPFIPGKSTTGLVEQIQRK